VLLPVHNGEPFLRASLESLLAQSFGDFELLVVDDGSTDASRAIAEGMRDPRVRVEVNPGHLGLVASLNRGLALARGELVARQDADDLSHPERLQLQRRFLDSHPEAALVGSEATVIDEGGRFVRRLRLPREHPSLRWWHLFDNGFVHSAVMFRASVVRDGLGGYRRLPHCEDFDLWSRVLGVACAVNLPEPLVMRRVHGGSVLGSLDDSGERQTALANRGVVAGNLAGLFADGDIDARDAETASLLRTGVPLEALEAFRALFSRLLCAYQRVFPGVTRRADFRRTLALQHAWLGRGLLATSLPAALRSTLASLRCDPRLVPALLADGLRVGRVPRA